MEEDAFKSALTEINDRKCGFERALLSRKHGCSLLEMFYIANRRGCNCKTEANAIECDAMLNLLRDKAKFVLHLKEIVLPLPHAKEIKIQMGGLTGLNKLMGIESSNVFDIHNLIAQINEKFEDLDTIPMQDIMTEIQKIQTRRPKKK
jgi:hypothetical protein